MTAGIPLILRKTGAHSAPLQQAHRQFILERSSEKIPISAEA